MDEWKGSLREHHHAWAYVGKHHPHVAHTSHLHFLGPGPMRQGPACLRYSAGWLHGEVRKASKRPTSETQHF